MSDDEFEALLRGSSDDAERPLDQRPPSRKERRQGSSRGAGAAILVTVLVILGGLAGAGWWGWGQYGEQVLDYLGDEEIPDFAGTGEQPEVLVIVEQGDIGEDVARKLVDQGVTASFESVYQLLLSDSSITFQPGTYRLLTEMSARAAVDSLLDPFNRVLYRVTIPEGRTLDQALQIIADETDISRADLDEAVENPTTYGISAERESLEGYVFPATYDVEPGSSASDVIQRMVDEMVNRLEDRGVEPDQWHTVLTKAALVQKEAKEEEDFYRVAAVIDNRLEDEMPLQFDSTVTYWEQTQGTVWTTDEARANADNPYNTYYYQGLPVGPIGLPGDLAIDAVLNPAEGDWKYFVTVNLQSGATVFSETLDEHNGAVQLLQEWCDQAENAEYCE